MNLISIQSEVDYLNWDDILQFLSLERLIPLYPMLGLPDFIIASPSSLSEIIQKHLLNEYNSPVRQLDDFHLFQARLENLFSELSIAYPGRNLSGMTKCLELFGLNPQHESCLFFWSILFRRLLNFTQESAGQLNISLTTKISSIITLQMYELDKDKLDETLYEVSLQPLTPWEKYLSERSTLTKSDVEYSGFPECLTPH